MPLTRDFDETVKSRAGRDPKFREALLHEAVGALRRGDVDLGKALAVQAAATGAELLQRFEDEADLAILRERLADGEVTDYVPHDQIVADLSE